LLALLHPATLASLPSGRRRSSSIHFFRPSCRPFAPRSALRTGAAHAAAPRCADAAGPARGSCHPRYRPRAATL